MTNEQKKWVGAVAVAFVLGVVLTLVLARNSDPEPSAPLKVVGAIGTKLPVENYIPVIAQNDGYYSTLAIHTTNALTVDGASIFATTTVAISFDGFTAGGGVTPSNVATGTKLLIYTHVGSPVACNAIDAILYADSTGYSPAMQVSVGLVTDVDLVASTTIATTTDSVNGAVTFRTILNAGDTIDMYFADGEGDGNAIASTTNFANWDVEFQMDCFLIGG